MKEAPAPQQIDAIITMYGGWKGEILSRLRAVIHQADPAVAEAVKWKTPSRPEGLPVWSHDDILCIVETFKNDIKLTFFKGAQLKDPKHLFNARLKSRTDRAIEFREGDIVREAELQALILEAVKLRTAKRVANEPSSRATPEDDRGNYFYQGCRLWPATLITPRLSRNAPHVAAGDTPVRKTLHGRYGRPARLRRE